MILCRCVILEFCHQKSTHEAVKSAEASMQEYLQTTNAAVEGVAQKAADALHTAAHKTEVHFSAYIHPRRGFEPPLASLSYIVVL